MRYVWCQFVLPAGLIVAGSFSDRPIVLLPRDVPPSRVNVIAERTHAPEPESDAAYRYMSALYEQRIHEIYAAQSPPEDEDRDP